MTYDLTEEEVEEILMCMSAAKILADDKLTSVRHLAKEMWEGSHNPEAYMRVAEKLDPERAQQAKDSAAAMVVEAKGGLQ